MNWVYSMSRGIQFVASIGVNYFSASAFSDEHPLSHKPNVNDIACINNDTSVWSNVVYPLYDNIIGVSFDPPQFVLEIETVPYQVS